jgi:hypothetical protein
LAAGSRIRWPDGKDFAFTVFDDTDLATLDNVPGVYDLLGDLGFRTTKSVWPIRGQGTPVIGGATCEDEAYRSWTLQLQAAGFEIGSHGASYVTSTRQEVIRGLDRFREIYGHDPRSLANHSGCAESIYWGADRTSGVAQLAYQAMTRFRRRGMFRGHVEGDPLFWGDVCRERVRYVRNFTYTDIDTLAACPAMPYHDPDRPYVTAWFAGSEGANVHSFVDRLGEANQDRLEAAGGACIMYTHFASGFTTDGGVDRRFRELMVRMSRKNGWFVPVATLLDFLADAHGGVTELAPGQRRALEWRWLRSKMRVGYS